MRRLSTAGRTIKCSHGGAPLIYRHACHPENAPGTSICLKEGDIDPTTGAPLAADQQPYGDSCYIPDLMCDDSIVFRTVLDDGTVGRKGRGGRPIFWRDALQTPPEPSTDPNVPTPAPPFPLDSFEEGGFYDGAVRIWGPLSDQASDVMDFGNAHAVSDGSAP